MQNGWETGKKQGQPLSGIALIPYYIYRTFASFAPHALKGQKLLAQASARNNPGRCPGLGAFGPSART